MNRKRMAILIVVALGLAYGAWHHVHADPNPVQLSTAAVVTGDIVQSVACTGTLEPLSTVEVGSQVSGTIKELGADFNSLVHKGEVLARLDTSFFETQLDQAKAAVAKAEGDLQVASAAVADASEKLNRARSLAARQLIPQSDLDDATVAMKEAEADERQAQAARATAQATVDQAQVTLEHAVIQSPVDGIVVARNVDVGQTVAASFEAPTLFSLAADLTKMKLTTVVDESDVGKVKVGQLVRFTVDAYPGTTFEGRVNSIHLQPETVQNVVSYDTLITIDNRSLQLRPGMTATASIEVARRDQVPRIPTLALRFRPTREVLAALGETLPAQASSIRPGATLLPGQMGEVWVAVGGRLEPRRVRVGLSDGQYVEVQGGLSSDAPVATGAFLRQAAVQVAATPSPLQPRMMFRR